MKKLMIALASAATAVFAFGEDVLPHGADFENANYTAGENFTNYVNKADDGAATSGNRYWYSTSEDIGVISNHQSGISVQSVPDLYENATPTGGVKYLQLDTQTRLFRTIANNDQSGSFTGVDMSTGDGVYLDTLVKFTAADAAFGTDALEEADKIAIEYVEREIEYGTGDEATVVKVTPLTNFVVRAGFIGSAFATNYLVDVPDGWLENNMKDDWHRLTVRALTNIDGNNRAGFKIYLDEEPLVYRTDKDEFAQSSGFEDDTHMIFPSAVASGVNKTTISAVAFSGNGSIDDVVFTTTKPKFIAESEAVVVPFVADAGVTAISVLPDGATDAILVDMTADPLVAVLPAQTTAFTVTATIDTVNGYKFVSTTVGDAVYDTNPASVTGYTGGDITITTIRNNFNLFDENGDPIQGTFQKLSEAFAAEGVAMIKLAYNYNALAFEGEDFDGYDIDGEIVLDLNGNDLDGGDDSAGVSLFRVADTLTIIDSVGGGSITYDTQYGYAIVKMDGSDAFIGAATGDTGATFNGKLFEDDYEGKIVKGYIDDANNADEGVFLWDSYVDGGSDYELVDDYWVVTPQSTPEPVIPTYVLTIPEVTGASAEVTSNDVVVADLAAIPSNTAVVVTWTLSEGYKLTAGSLTENITMDSNKEAATPTVAAIDYATLTIESVANCTIVVSNATDEVATGTKFDKGDAEQLTVYRTPAEGYELDGYAASETITMNQDQTVTAAVKAAGGSYPSYIDDTTKQTKYDTWKSDMAAAGVDVGDGTAYEDAFLLNCKPAEVEAAKAAFKFTSISYDTTQQKWVATTTTSYNDREFNGTVTVKQYSDVGCTTESKTGTFFKAVLQ